LAVQEEELKTMVGELSRLVGGITLVSMDQTTPGVERRKTVELAEKA
jgi:hypothetical protein